MDRLAEMFARLLIQRHEPKIVAKAVHELLGEHLGALPDEVLDAILRAVSRHAPSFGCP